MALPKLTTPTYELELPSTGQKIKYRPFLVKEQKLLMMAQESEDENEIAETIQRLISSCTFGKVDAIVSPIFDIVLNDEKHTNIVNVTNTVKMVMGYPRLADIKAMKNTTDNIFQLLMKCIVEVHDGDTIHNRTDVSDKELAEFVDSFNTEQLQSLMQFFETMPKVRHVINVTNPNTKVTSEMTLEGMETFLV